MESVRKIKQLIKETSDQLRTVEELCQEAGIDYQSIRKTFRRREGISLSEYQQQCRQRKAQDLLAKPRLLVFEVAYEMGFRDEAYFSNWFKKRTGYSPTAFREEVLKIGGG